MPVVSFEMQVKHIPKKGTKLSSYLHQAGFNDEAYILKHHMYYQFWGKHANFTILQAPKFEGSFFL